MTCRLLRIEHSDAHARFVCACGTSGAWRSSWGERDAQRNAEVSWRCHVTSLANWRKPRGGAHRKYTRDRDVQRRSLPTAPLHLEQPPAIEEHW